MIYKKYLKRIIILILVLNILFGSFYVQAAPNNISVVQNSVDINTVSVTNKLISSRIIQIFESQTQKHLQSIDQSMNGFYLKYIYDIRSYILMKQIESASEIYLFRQNEINRIDYELSVYAELIAKKYEKQLGNDKKKFMDKVDKIIINKQKEI